MPPEQRESRGWQYLGVGCLTTVAGFFGGGMIGVFVGWIAGHLRGCAAPEGFPICDFFPYWITGMLVGAVLLPTVAITRIRRSVAANTANPADTKGDSGGSR